MCLPPPSTTRTDTLFSLRDALPISLPEGGGDMRCPPIILRRQRPGLLQIPFGVERQGRVAVHPILLERQVIGADIAFLHHMDAQVAQPRHLVGGARKSTRLNSSQ